jgi:hypothetical protein
MPCIIISEGTNQWFSSDVHDCIMNCLVFGFALLVLATLVAVCGLLMLLLVLVFWRCD